MTAKEYYKLDYASIPDNLFHSRVPVEKWLEHSTTTTAGADGFPPNSLNRLSPLDRETEIERIVGITLYMTGNLLPFASFFLIIFSLYSALARTILLFVLMYVGILFVIGNFYFKPRFMRRYDQSGSMTNDIKENQYFYTEFNSCKYCSLRVVWPKSMHRPSFESKPIIFCAIPHGAAPLGITAYPIWSKLWNDKLCHWTTAPIVLKIPIVSYFMKKIGYIPAKSKNIMETLTKKEENVGVILDGIAGMFQTKQGEVAHIEARKGIVKIALRAGVSIVPIYGFGHSQLWTVVVDPFGILKRISIALDMAFTPFFGRFFWFLGPPRRIPITVCLGEPIVCPQIDEPTNQDISKYHKLMLKGFEAVFDKHKEAYGWSDKKIKFV